MDIILKQATVELLCPPPSVILQSLYSESYMTQGSCKISHYPCLPPSRSMSSPCYPMPTWSTCPMPPVSTSLSSVPTSNTASVSKPWRKSFNRTCPDAMALLPWNISRLRTTASTLKATTRERHATGEELLAAWGPAFEDKMHHCFSLVCFPLSLWPHKAALVWDLGQGPSPPPWGASRRMEANEELSNYHKATDQVRVSGCSPCFLIIMVQILALEKE